MVEEHIKDWILKISAIRPELGNFAICPFSSTASYKVIESPIDDIMPIKGCDVVIFVVEDYLDLMPFKCGAKFTIQSIKNTYF